MVERRKNINKLPVVHQTEPLKKVFDSTVDQLFQPYDVERLNGFIGRKPDYFNPETDIYVPELTETRNFYSLEPTAVINNKNDKRIMFYQDLVNHIRFQGGKTNDENRLFEQTYYSWSPPVDIDKIINYTNYFWFENGPEPIEINDKTDVENEILGKKHFTTKNNVKFSSGMRVIFKNNINTKYNNIVFGIEAVGKGIILINDENKVNAWDTSSFDKNPWDLSNFDKRPDYFVMERGAKNNNEWSTKNRWYHKDVIGETSLVEALQRKAERPIIEFVRDLELYNYGTIFKQYVDVIDTKTKDIFNDLNGLSILKDFEIDGVPVRDGLRILVTNDVNNDVNNRVLNVKVVRPANIFILEFEDEKEPKENEVINVNFGVENKRKQFYFFNNEWVPAQRKLGINQKPLFQLYDIDGVRLNDEGIYPENNFEGSTIFEYFVDEDFILDSVLNVKLKRNDFGEFVFKNTINTTYSYEDNKEIKGFYFHKRSEGDFHEEFYSNDWYPTDFETRQYVFDEFNVGSDLRKTFTISQIPDEQIENAPKNLFVEKNGINLKEDVDFTLDKKSLRLASVEKNDRIEVRSWSQIPRDNIKGFYEIPVNLQGNPNNLELNEISSSELLNHFVSIIENQKDIEGNPFSTNNWRDTAQRRNFGRNILQNQSSLLKTMALANNDHMDIAKSINYASREYTRFRNRFIRKIKQFSNSSFYTNLPPSKWVDDAIQQLNIGKTNDFPFFYSNMIGIEKFIPSTPSNLGMYSVFKPEIFEDDSFTIPVGVIRGHDGSIYIKNNDIRDEVILELENRIYNNIPDKIKEKPLVFDYLEYVSGKYRNTDYPLEEFNQLLQPIFERWIARNQLNYRENRRFDPNNAFTWNFSGVIDRDGTVLPGSWKAIYRFYFDTIRPHSHPWEMLGFGEKPSWWDARYGIKPYTKNNNLLWNDLENGFIAEGNKRGINEIYKRPGLSKVIPADLNGNLLDPVDCGIVNRNIPFSQISKNWEFGEEGTVESVWRRSESYPYAIALASYFMKPSQFVELTWDTTKFDYIFENQKDGKQWINLETRNRPKNSELSFHTEILNNGDVYISHGIQQWIVDYLISQGMNVKELSNTIRNVDVQLGHKMGGFVDISSANIRTENFGNIPNEDIEVINYSSPSIREEIYSGVLIEWTGKGFKVIGYDIINPYFNIIPSDQSAKKININVGEASVNLIKEPVDKEPVERVSYGTVFTTRQKVFDFLISYGRYLESRGWIFDQRSNNLNETIDWVFSGKQFVFWSLGNWSAGNFITVSPLSEKATFKTDHGYINPVEQIINGTYSLLKRDGSPIRPENTFVTREDGKISIKPNNAQRNGIFSVRLFINEKEHALLFNNKTIFDDVMYIPLLNIRQPRIRVFNALRSVDWKGRFEAPGFIISGNTIVPNFEKTATDFKEYYNISNPVTTSSLRDHSRHLIGFERRDYLKNLLFDNNISFQFYQGTLGQKGTENVLDRLMRSEFVNETRNIKFFEEWAFRLSRFGATENNSSLEFKLPQNEIKNNPQLIEFKKFNNIINDNPSDTILNISENSDLWVFKKNEDFPFMKKGETKKDHMLTAGPIKSDEFALAVKSKTDLFEEKIISPLNIEKFENNNDQKTFFFENSYENLTKSKIDSVIVDNELITNFSITDTSITFNDGIINSAVVKIKTPNKIWLTNTESGDWDYLRATNPRKTIKRTVEGLSDNDPGIVVLDSNNDFENKEFSGLVSIKDHENSEPDLNSYYEISTKRTISIQLRPNSFENIDILKYIVDSGITINNIKIETLQEFDDDVLFTIRDNKNEENIIAIIEDEFKTKNITNIVPNILNEDADLVGIFDPNSSELGIANILIEIEYKKGFELFRNNVPFNIGTGGINGNVWKYDSVRFNNETDMNSYNPSDLLVEDEIVVVGDRFNWKIFEFNTINFEKIRQNEKKIDVERLENTLIYDNKDNRIRQRLTVFDPLKGYYPGIAEKELFYKTPFDPASYNNDDQENGLSWGENEVGRLWLDTSDIRYFDYEQSTNYYRSNNWGRLAPGSNIKVFEWVRSPVPPEDWQNFVNNFDSDSKNKPSGIIEGDPETIPFVFKEKLNNKKRKIENQYYFWVLNKKTIPNTEFRNISALDVSNILEDPTKAFIPWFSITNTDSMIVSNASAFLNDDNTILQTNWKQSFDEGNIHNEWQLVRPNDSRSVPDDLLWNKMRDSLVGFVSNTDLKVPDPSLSEIERYGNFYRPRQSWFENKKLARKQFIECINKILKNICLTDKRLKWEDKLFAVSPEPFADFVVNTLDDLNKLNVKLQNTVLVKANNETFNRWTLWKFNGEFVKVKQQLVNMQENWDFIDWFEKGFSFDDPIDITFSSKSEMQENIPFQENTLIHVDSNEDGNFERWFSDENQELILVGKQNCTIKFNNLLYNDDRFKNNKNTKLGWDLTAWDTNEWDKINSDIEFSEKVISNELLTLINALKQDIFKNIEINELFFCMVNFVHAEQNIVDWAFKTSYMVISGFNETLEQTPFDNKDNIESIIDYINEVKPYHVKIRDFVRSLSPPQELANTSVTDFDKPVSQNGVLNIETDKEKLQEKPWVFWFNNFETNKELIRNIKIKLLFDRVSCDKSDGYDINAFDAYPFDSVNDKEFAVDRILKYYNPTSYMRKKEINELLKGCEFNGTILSDLEFEKNVINLGWDIQSWDTNEWDNLVQDKNNYNIECNLESENRIINLGWDILAWDTNEWDKNNQNDSRDLLLNDNTTNKDHISFFKGNNIKTEYRLPFIPASVLNEIKPFYDTNNDYNNDVDWYNNDISLKETVEVLLDGAILELNNEFVVKELPINSNNWFVVFNTPPKENADISITVKETFTENRTESSIDVEGNKLIQPNWNENHPEELISTKLQDSTTLNVFTQHKPGAAIIENSRILIDDFNIKGPYKIKQIAASVESIFVYINKVLVNKNNYDIDFIGGLLTFKNDFILNKGDELKITSIDIGSGFDSSNKDKNIIKTIFEKGDGNKNIFDTNVNITGKVFVTVDGEISKFSKSNNEIVLSSTPLNNSDIIITIFDESTTDLNIIETEKYISGKDFIGNTLTLRSNNVPGLSTPYHNKVIVTNNNGFALKPPFTEYFIGNSNTKEFLLKNRPENNSDLVVNVNNEINNDWVLVQELKGNKLSNIIKKEFDNKDFLSEKNGKHPIKFDVKIGSKNWKRINFFDVSQDGKIDIFDFVKEWERVFDKSIKAKIKNEEIIIENKSGNVIKLRDLTNDNSEPKIIKEFFGKSLIISNNSSKINFNNAPLINSNIVIFDKNLEKQFYMKDKDTIEFDFNNVEIKNDDEIVVTSFSNDKNLEIKSEIFKGNNKGVYELTQNIPTSEDIFVYQQNDVNTKNGGENKILMRDFSIETVEKGWDSSPWDSGINSETLSIKTVNDFLIESESVIDFIINNSAIELTLIADPIRSSDKTKIRPEDLVYSINNSEELSKNNIKSFIRINDFGEKCVIIHSSINKDFRKATLFNIKNNSDTKIVTELFDSDEISSISSEWDSVEEKQQIVFPYGQKHEDRILIYTFGGEKQKPPIAFKQFLNSLDTTKEDNVYNINSIDTRISDRNKGVLVENFKINDTEIKFKANPNVPLFNLRSPILSLPDKINKIPGSVFVGNEKIDFWNINGPNDLGIYTLSELQREKKITSGGVKFLYKTIIHKVTRNKKVFELPEHNNNLQTYIKVISKNPSNLNEIENYVFEGFEIRNNKVRFDKPIPSYKNVIITVLESDFLNSDVIHENGTIIVDAGQQQLISGGYKWFPTPNGLQNSTRNITTFLQSAKGTKDK